MNLNQYIADQVQKQGRTKLWVAEQTQIKYQKLVDKLKNGRVITGEELLKLANVLDIDLNELKNTVA
jgi:hypothetical protein